MSRLSLTAILAAVAALGAPAAARADFVLDNFSNPSPGTIYQVALLNSNPYTAPTTATGTAGVTRDVTVTVVAPLPPNFNSVSGTIGGGQFSMNTDSTSTAVSQLKYTLTGTAQNLSKDAGLALSFKAFDPGIVSGKTVASAATSLTIAVNTTGGNKTLNTVIPGTGVPATNSYAFSSFAGAAWDLTHVTSIVYTINGGNALAAQQAAVDFTLTGTKAYGVPAPAGLVLAGFGLVGLVARSRFTRRPPAAA